jgi:hypothetical protein
MAKFSLSSWFRKMLGKGVNKDIAPELLPDGYARSQFHVRPTSTVGATGSVEAVGGEQLLYNTNIVGQDTYVSIGSWMVNGRVVEFWASSQANLYDPLVRIDGVVAAQSPNIPYTFDRPLQAAVETRCRGGVIYPADHQSPPLYWDVDDMLEQLNSGSATYFGDYIADFNSVALSTPAEFPRFSGLISGIQGLPAGKYIYSLRYVTPAGDRTNRGPETPAFSVPRVQDSAYDTIYPGGRTTGGVTDLLAPTQYGIRLEFRIDNTQGYESVEVCRQRFNDGQGISNPGQYEVVGRIPITPGQFNIISYEDPGEFGVVPAELIPADEAANQQETINAPKSVELADNRLLYANYQTNPLITDLTFATGPTGATMIPITQRLTTVDQSGIEFNSGHNDPFNLAYYQSFMRGERYGFGIQLWDNQSAKLPVVPIAGLEDYQFPNRRDVKGPLGAFGADSIFYSTDNIDAANTQCQSSEPVTPTYDSVTQGSKQRVEFGSTINVLDGQGIIYRSLLPISPVDANISTNGWNIPPQTGRYNNPNGGSGTFTSDTGQIFDQRHHALGGLLYGISGIPSNVKAITLARTQPANRVVAQGFGFWDMRNGTADEGFRMQRSANSLRVHFPDIDAGLVSQATIDDIQENPDSYRVQLVSYFGFYQDVYGYAPLTFIPNSENIGKAADMLMYASVQHDEGQVNVFAPADGYTRGPNSDSPLSWNYIGPGKWRNPNFYGQASQLPFNTSPDQGNVLYNISDFQEVLEGRGSYWRLQTGQFIYTSDSQNTDGAIGLNSDEIRRFQQPVYTVNIVRIGAEVPDQTTQLYVNTGTTIKMASTVGVMPAGSPQVVNFRLLNERLEDVRPYVLGTTVDSLRYLWVKEPGLPERAWVNMTNTTIVDQGDVIDAIIANGFWLSPDGTQVYGVYQVVSDQLLQFGMEFSSGVGYSILLGSFSAPGGVLPPEGTRFTVKFCGKNIRVFGGDCTISKQVYSPYDGFFNEPASSVRLFGVPPPMPMWGIIRSNNYNLPYGTFGGGSVLNEQRDVFQFRNFRQLAVMWDAETRVNSVMNLFSPREGVDHIHTNYIIRPFYNTSLSSGAANGFYPQFDTEYTNLLGYNVAEEFHYGGIQFRRNSPTNAPYNYDYSKQPNVTFVGLPEVGYEDRSDLCNAIAASNEVDPAAQDQPGLRTFLSANIKLLSQENGEIKVIASALGEKAGRNMYAWTEKGVSRILTNKNILSGASGEQISTQEISNYWGDEMVLTSNIGLPDQMWRMFAKAYAPIGSGYADSFFWMDRKGVYRMTNDNIVDISRDRYLSALTETLQNFPTDYSLNVGSLYNTKDNEVWFGISEQSIAPDPPVIPAPIVIPPRLFVYNALRNEWIDQFAFQFDTYLANDQQLYGFRDLQTYNLDVGSTINGLTREAKVMVPFFGDIGRFKQHLRWRITPSGALADAKPDEIRIYDESMNLLSIQNEALAAAVNPAEAQYWVLWYDGWEQHTACSPASIDPQERPPQSHGFFVELIWRTEGYKSLLAVSSQLQNIH